METSLTVCAWMVGALAALALFLVFVYVTAWFATAGVLRAVQGAPPKPRPVPPQSPARPRPPVTGYPVGRAAMAPEPPRPGEPLPQTPFRSPSDPTQVMSRYEDRDPAAGWAG